MCSDEKKTKAATATKPQSLPQGLGLLLGIEVRAQNRKGKSKARRKREAKETLRGRLLQGPARPDTPPQNQIGW